MNEKYVIRTAMIAVIIGFIILYLFSSFKEAPLSSHFPQEKVFKIKGTITEVHTIGKAMYLTIDGEKIESTQVILFPSTETSLNRGDYVEVTGIQERYNNQDQIVAETITKK